MKKYCIVLVAILFGSILYAKAGNITGKVSDSKTGEPIPGAVVMIDDSSKKDLITGTDPDGNYTIANVPSGTYNVICSYVSYKKKKVTDVMVKAEETTPINILLEPTSFELTGFEIVTAKVTNTEAAVLAEVRKSENVVSGISAAQIQKSQDPDASAVVKRIPGVTIIENRFIMVRGLNDRYNNIWLNDGAVPSSETDKKAFSFDVIPAGLIDRILVYKTPSADLPGDFAGGMVKIYTKSVPENTGFSFEIKGSDRTGTTGNTYDFTSRSSTDIYGYDHGFRALPSTLNPYVSKGDSNILDESRAFKTTWGIQHEKALPDLKANLFYSQLIKIKKLRIGNSLGLIYSAGRSIYDIERKDWDSTALVSDYNDHQCTRTIRSGMLENLAFEYKTIKIECKNLLNQLGTEQTVSRFSNLTEGANEKSYLLSYEARTTYSGQLAGSYKSNNEKLSYNCTAGYSYVFRNLPDLRRIKYTKNQDAPDSMYKTPIANVVDPINGGGRLFSTLLENIRSLNQSLKYKVIIKNYSFDITAGAYLEKKDRTFEARMLGYTITPGLRAFNLTRLPIETIFSDTTLGTQGGFKLDEMTSPSDKYAAQNDLQAGFGMVSFSILKKIKITSGIRYEYNKQSLQSHVNLDSISPEVITKFWLPSVNVSYDINEKHLVRAAFGKSLNRPEFREWSPFYFYDFNFNAGTYGSLFPTVLSPNGSLLNVAGIRNYDLRYEYYPGYSELIQIGFFHKDFTDPIQQVILSSGSDSRSYTFVNGESATVDGIEIDARKNLSFLNSLTKNNLFSDFFICGNASIIKSKLNINKTINQEGTTSLQGQSPYVVNGGIYYQNDSVSLQASILYNVFGPRIYLLGTLDYPNIGELARGSLDLNISKRFKKHFTFLMAAQNILNASNILVQDTNKDHKFSEKDGDQLIMKYKQGVYYTMGLKFSF